MNPVMLRIAASILVLAASEPAHAITFFPSEKPDPFAPGKTCPTFELGSMGSYVYSWPSKYDLVFSPWDYGQFTWRCPSSGYVALMPDFAIKDPAVQARIAAYLATSAYRPSNGAQSQPDARAAELAHMDAINGLRGLPPAEMAHRLRLFAWIMRTEPQADAYRRRAKALHETLLAKGELSGLALADTLYVLGYYSRKFGDHAASKKHFGQLRAMTVPAEEKGGLEYLIELAGEVDAGKGDDAIRFKQP